MLPSELKLTCLGHCYVHLPETFVSAEPSIKGGATVCVKSVQNDTELYVMWNGRLTLGEYVQLDFTFAQANKFKDELVIISLVDKDLDLSECSFCRAELLNPADYSIVSQHGEVNLLDSCRLITKNLIVPVFLSQNVKVLVKIVAFEPNQPFALLAKWTELQFEHKLDNSLPSSTQEVSEGNDQQTKEPASFIDCVLGLDYRPQFYLGSMVVCGERGSGKTYLVKKILENYKKYRCILFNCKQLRGKRPESVKKKFNEIISEALDKQPAIVAMDDIDAFLSRAAKHEEEQGQDALYKARLVDVFCSMVKRLERQRTNGNVPLVVLILTCRSIDSLDERLSKPKGRHYFTEIIKLHEPSPQQRTQILKNMIEEHKEARADITEEQLNELGLKFKSFMPTDIRTLYERVLINACSRSNLDFNADPITVKLEDFTSALSGYIPKNLRTIALQPKQSKTFKNVGGMSAIKDVLIKTVLMPIKYPKLYKKCPIRPQNSILLYGPPGCGKTLIAEALTNQEGINSICVRGPELISKYIGASEAGVRDLFRRAEMARPCVIFFDEFESLVSTRGADSTGVTDRIVNQFLTILDGVEALSSDIFIVAATSRPDMIDPAMLRPGRLDRHIYCPLPDVKDRIEILKVLSKDMDVGDDVEWSLWSKELEGFTGADLQALLYSAQLKALHELIDPSSVSPSPPSSTENLVGGGSIERLSRSGTSVSGSNKSELKIKVLQRHMDSAFDEMKGSVSAKLDYLLKCYPVTIGQGMRSRVAMRATLA